MKKLFGVLVVLGLLTGCRSVADAAVVKTNCESPIAYVKHNAKLITQIASIAVKFLEGQMKVDASIPRSDFEEFLAYLNLFGAELQVGLSLDAMVNSGLGLVCLEWQ